jgi:hypothetical protein
MSATLDRLEVAALAKIDRNFYEAHDAPSPGTVLALIKVARAAAELASDCMACGGKGYRWAPTPPPGHIYAPDIPCPVCADIRAALATLDAGGQP